MSIDTRAYSSLTYPAIHLLLVLVLISVAAGCADLDKTLGEKINHALAGNSPRPVVAGDGGATFADSSVPGDYRSVAETELAGFFERHAQPGAGRIVQWPRVAITVVGAPPWHLKSSTFLGNSTQQPGPACWKFKARIWESATVSRTVSPFYYCNTKEDLRVTLGQEGIRYNIWSGLLAPPTTLTTTKSGSTGIKRTEGPNFPDTPLPTTIAYKRANFGSSWTGVVVHATIEALRMDYTVEDARLWVNLDPSLEPT